MLFVRSLLVLSCLGLLTACASAPTVYAPSGASGGPGWSESRIETDRWRIRFDGGSDIRFPRLEDCDPECVGAMVDAVIELSPAYHS